MNGNLVGRVASTRFFGLNYLPCFSLWPNVPVLSRLNEFDGAMIVRVKHLESAYVSKVHRQRIQILVNGEPI